MSSSWIMVFTDLEIAEHLALLEDFFWVRRRPDVSLREQIREGQRLSDQSIELFYLRPAYRRPDEFIESPIAKLQFVRARNVWKIFWKRADRVE